MTGHERILVVAPHPDDEVLGCGGTIAKLAQAGHEVTVLAVCADLPPLYEEGIKEKVKAEALAAHKLLGVRTSLFLDYPAVEVSRMPLAILNAGIKEVVDSVRPHVVFAPFADRHADHRAVFDATIVATRPIGVGKDIRMVALYETVSETFWNVPGAEPTFQPQWSVDISTTLQEKLDAFAAFASQVQEYPGPRSMHAIASLAGFRGSQVSLEYAEAFHVVRMTSDEMKHSIL